MARHRQFTELRADEIDELGAHLVEEVAAWLYDRNIAGASRVPEWVLAQRIRATVRAAHVEAQRRVLEQAVR